MKRNRLGVLSMLLCLLFVGGMTMATVATAAPGGHAKTEKCTNGRDDDKDGLVDCADPDCAGDPACAPPAEICNNGIDDDGDSLVDCADPDCASDPACVCQPTPEVCTNGLDDDCDTLVDCADPDCAADPACAPPAEICNNGVDDDGDTLVDCADPDCASDPACAPTAENCANGHDDDGDGQVDCADSDCAGDVACATGQHAFNILMNYELGMHCTGFEFAYCCVLPPYNSILAQVVKTDKTAAFPRVLEADPNVGLDGLGRPTVVRDPVLSGSGFKKYQLRYWHDAQPRNDGRGAPQTSTLISIVEGNSLLMWNTVAEGATTSGGALVYGTTDGATNVVQGDGDFNDANDNYWNAVWNHLYFYENLEGSNSTNSTAEADKIRLGIDVIYPENTGAALHPVGPGVVGAGFDNVLTFSGDTGTVVYTQMKVLENLPVMLTSPRIWEALGLPLTPFEDTINFFADPGAVDEDSIRPYVKMNAQLEEYPSGAAVLDNGQPVIGFGTAPIDIPNCERCHSLGVGPVNSAQTANPGVNTMVQDEIDFWNAYYGIGPGDSDWYSRLKGAAISILAIHDDQHGTNFTGAWPVLGGGQVQATRLGHGSVICQRCHADNVIAVVKSANTGAGDLIMPLTEAIHNNHKDNPFSDSLGRNGGCQGCHPAHRSDGDMRNYPITEDGLNAFAASDNRDAAGGCFVGRDVHSNRNKDADGVGTPSHLNAVGQWLANNVASDTGTWKGIWCTNCHSQLGQELWKTENCPDLIHGDCITNPRGASSLAAVAAAVGVSEAQAIAWLDPKNNADTATIWTPAASLCDWLVGNAAPEENDGNVATIEVAITSGGAGMTCSTGASIGPVDCSGVGGPVFNICGTFDGDVSPDFSVNILDFCTTADCVAAAQATLVNSAAVAVPMSAATDGRDHWLAPGEPHCADCHAAPYVEQSGNITAYPPFNYPRKASLFRYTRGHQDITCQGCHESIHGLYPSAQIVNQDGDTVTIDTTTYAQAAYLNADGSHGPLKCAACHDVDGIGIPQWIRSGLGTDVNTNYDAAVGWAHTFTDEASVLGTGQVCRNCHGVQGTNWSEIVNPDGTYLRHAMDGRVSRTMMDKAEIEKLGHVHGDPAFENPLANNSSAICQGCHGSEVSNVSCSNTTWKRHLTEGRVAESVWVYVSQTLTGTTCGW